MRTTTLLIALSLALAPAYAATPNAIKLGNQNTVGATVSGTCGPASVRVIDAEKQDPINEAGFNGFNTVIEIQSGAASLTIDEKPHSGTPIYLQDRNKLHCVSTPTGPKLLVVMHCFGSRCASVDYRVIDPKTAKVISKQDDMDECNVACAQKALGAPVPANLKL